ncbi:MAG: tetratricopeptide repeat protein [Rhizobacter sp.]|nr:tetratricopeptide repeat protein [Rhizobacter sp.]
MLHRLIWRGLLLIAALSVVAIAAAAPAVEQNPLSRAEALQAIEQGSVGERRAAVERLAVLGTMPDADQLVARLADEDAQVRLLTEAALWQIWSRSGEPAIDALYWRGMQQMQGGQLADALATFSDIIRRKPEFAEGWNKRATILYMLGEYHLSLQDCDEVMKRNRHHFGALSGYGQIYLALGDFVRARQFFQRALEVNPNMHGAAQAIEWLEQQIERQQRKTI